MVDAHYNALSVVAVAALAWSVNPQSMRQAHHLVKGRPMETTSFSVRKALPGVQKEISRAST
jgi:hypothetical protein